MALFERPPRSERPMASPPRWMRSPSLSYQDQCRPLPPLLLPPAMPPMIGRQLRASLSRAWTGVPDEPGPNRPGNTGQKLASGAAALDLGGADRLQPEGGRELVENPLAVDRAAAEQVDR